MSPRLPRVTAGKVIRVLERQGFVLSRSSGSHHIYKNPNSKRVTVPVHAKKTLHPKTSKSILRDMDMTVQQLIEEL